MKINSQPITDKLEKIRRQVGGKWVDFVPAAISIDEDLPEGQPVSALFHESGLLIYNGRPVFAYIRDHTVGGFPYDPKFRKKIHFTVCAALTGMKRQGRFERYRVITREDNRYPVDISVGGYRAVEREERLYPCQYCLGNAGYRCFDYRMPPHIKDGIIQGFDAREAFPLLRQQFAIFKKAMTGAKSAMLPSGYPRNWQRHSKEFRKSRNFTCEPRNAPNPKDRGCGVCLSEYPWLTDAHHKIPDKSDIRYDNLLCLCKLCHQSRHPHHYSVSLEDKRIIENARRRQGIF